MACIRIRPFVLNRKKWVVETENVDISMYSLVYVNDVLRVSRNGDKVIETDGENFVDIGSSRFEKGGFLLKELFIGSESLSFDWSPKDSGDSIMKPVCDVRHKDNIYRIVNYELYKLIYLTKTEIYFANDDVNLDMIIGILAFFWVHYEKKRLYF